MEFAASFDAQLSTLAPFIFYVVVAGIVFIETGLLFGFFLPGQHGKRSNGAHTRMAGVRRW